MKPYNLLHFLPMALAAPPVVDPFLQVCRVSVTFSAITNTLLLPPQTISLCDNTNCANPTIVAGGGVSSGSPEHQDLSTQLPQETGSQFPGGNPPAGQPAATQSAGDSATAGQLAATQPPGSNLPTAKPAVSQAPGGNSPAGSSAGGSNGNPPAATASALAGSGMPTAVTTSSASRSFGAQWDELLVMGVITLVVVASLGLGL
ncbi:hypothetical protein CORC01_05742 [Colletotrichum orchidophilum]|uniref:Uncharacterized protein n=1 Tax=Colletotrichum orchidophilum TaxID=1209926 RepID=A0A1G4BCK5_9PEZI|nr:uncharacterized protein CORC01_05742 [Colletotrichum orchidophilum]OHE99052.1 hypothetical protein CORC01_05742 [Colletotrichum orchidophilum]